MRKIRRAWKQSSKKLRFILYILIIVLLFKPTGFLGRKVQEKV